MAGSEIAAIPTVSNRGEFKKKGRKQTLDGKFRFDLDRCSKNKDLKGALTLYDAAISQNISLSHYHYNALLYLCSTHASDSCSRSEQSDSAISLSLEYGFRIFDHMLSKNITPNEATITSVARLAAVKGDGNFAFELVKTMHKYNALPRLRTYDPALFCFCGRMEADRAYEVEEHMNAMGLSAEEPEIAELLKVSMNSGRDQKVYNYIHKLRSSVGCVSESTAEIIERWFSEEGACLVGGEGVDVRQIDGAMSKNGGGWHGLGWLGNGEWITRRSSVNIDGFCVGCSGNLVCVDIDAKDTERFEHSIAQLAMEREAKSNFGKFQAWLENHGAYEAIIDGANVGLYQQNFADGGFSFSQLDAVVQELYSMHKKWPLVILHNKRLHSLLNSPARKNVEEWVSRGKLYATPNGSNDDWYWLYAAVKLKCLLVTNDEMRDHIFELLGRNFILKWKERHQVHYTFIKGDIKLQMPPSYSIVIQESKEGSWHVPIASEHVDECSRRWLCIARK